MSASDSAGQLAAAVRSGERSAAELTEAALAAIAAGDGPLRAFVDVQTERARTSAAAVDKARARGEALGPLCGVPIAYKDNFVLSGEGATAGSKILKGFRSPYTATVLQKLEAAGAVLIGRTNMDEFGMGSTTTNSAYGPTSNPFGHDLVAGGSSGGSAVAVAAGFCPLAIGSDTGGSVRQPAALCGVIGLKPTYGRVSRSGLIAYASSLDCVGAIARDAADLALWLDVVSGSDPRDPTSLPERANVAPQLDARTDLRGLRIAAPWQLNGPGLDPEVAAATAAMLALAERLGAVRVDADLPLVEHAVPTYYLIAAAEAASNLARYDGVRYGQRRDPLGRLEALYTQSRSSGFGDEVQLRILLGTFASSFGHAEQFYQRATAARTALQQAYAQLFTECDLVLSPTSPVPAFAKDGLPDDPLALYLCDALTVPPSLCGLPAISQPAGFTQDRRPIGVQWTASHCREDLLLQVCHTLQQHSDHHRFDRS